MQIEIPTRRPYMIAKENKILLDAVDSFTAEGRNTNVLIRGPQGSGKSELVNQFGASRQRPTATIEVGLLSEASEIFYTIEIENGKTVFVPGLFTEAIQTPNCVVHLQELNRADSDKALNAIFSVLDDNVRGIWINEAKKFIKVAPGVTFFASLNEGYKFTGVMPLDAALEDRFMFKLELNGLPRHQENMLLTMKVGLMAHQSQELLDRVSEFRENAQEDNYISTRSVITMAELIKRRVPIEVAFKSVVGGGRELEEQLFMNRHFAGEETNVNNNVTFELL